MALNKHVISHNISNNSVTSDDSFVDNILEENGRISLAYENLDRIPRRIAEKFAAHTHFLDLSYNNFQNLSFLAYFEELHTLILDRNTRLQTHTFPYLPNLRILWINNCNIENVIDWIQRIAMQCPLLEQLSLMGNPGVNKQFNYCTLAPHSSLPISLVTDCRTYILDILPKLEFLDGIIRSAPQNFSKIKERSMPDLDHSNESNVTTSKSSNSRKSSPILNFKDLFKLTLRKRATYHSSSTN